VQSGRFTCFYIEGSEFSEMQITSRIPSQHELQCLCQFALQVTVNPAMSDIILWADIGFGKFSCYYCSANRVVPSGTEVRTFRRRLEILTFDELRKCLPCAVKK
jgi:hypothetical protein